jgi:hypothetical protein
MILAALDAMQARLTLEKLGLYSAHFEQDIYVLRCQTVSHLSTVLIKPSIGAFSRGVQKAAEKSTAKLHPRAKFAQKGRSNNKMHYNYGGCHALLLGWQVRQQTTEI